MKPGQHMLDRRLDVAVEPDAGEHCPQRPRRKHRERLLAPGGGQGETVPQQHGEPQLGEVAGCADVGEPVRHRRHVGQRLVDVEDDHGRASGHAGSCRERR